MEKELGVILEIKEVNGLKIQPVGPLNGSNGSQLGLAQMISALGGYGAMDGYEVKTDKHTFYILIDNGQSCCENWGYMSSDDEFKNFIGSKLLGVELTDTALNKQKVDDEIGGIDCGGIQFVDFKTNKGVLQLAVYNSHNGYYGHSIVVAKDNEILTRNTL